MKGHYLLITKQACIIKFVVLIAICLTFVAGIKAQVTVIQQTFSGQRYLVLDNTFVYSEPNENSRIVNDLVPLRMVYAEPTKGSWAKIYASGLRKYPDSFQGFAGFGTIQFVDGKFVPPKTVDRDKYYVVNGYVRLSDLGPMESPSPIPIPAGSLRSLPQMWPGIPEKRKVPVNPAQYPFSSVVKIVISAPSTDGKHLYAATCSGFFIENRITVASAGHCVTEGLAGTDIQKEKISYKAIVKAGTKEEQSRLLQLIKYEFSGVISSGIVDWAIFRIADGKPINIRPLNLATVGAWTEQGTVNIMQLGFATDLAFVKRKMLGVEQVHIDQCVVPLSTTRVNKWGIDNTFQDADCVSIKGDSGGPIVIYNNETKRFEVIGIYSWGTVILKWPKLLDKPSLEYFTKHSTELHEQYQTGQPYLADEFSIPGIASLIQSVRFYTMNKAQDGMVLNKAFLDALSEETGTPKSSEAYLSQFAADKTALWVDRPKNKRQPEMEPLETIPSVLGRYENSIRDALFRTRVLQDPKYQQKLTRGDVLDLNILRSKSIPFQVHSVAYSTIGNFAIPPDGVDATIGRLKPASENRENLLGMAVARSIIKQLQKFQVVRVGGDAFLIDQKTGYIWAVSRNWMNFFEGDFDAVRAHEEFPKQADTPIDGKFEPKSNVPPQSTLRMTDFGTETPATIPGAKTVSIKEAWQLIANKDPKKRAVVLAAMDDVDIVPPGAIDFSFGAIEGDFDDKWQKMLREKIAIVGVKKDQPIVIFCHNKNCWLSYNLGLRLIHEGYTNVNWMRDGLEGWWMGLSVSKLKPVP